MHYTVEARLKPDAAHELLHKLTDGTIEKQKPDGREIVDSMQRATIDASGVVRWSEVCYCATPLEHERETVYDHYFTDLETREAEDYVEFEGQPFMEHLARLAETPSR